MGQCLEPEAVSEEDFISYVGQFGVEKEWIKQVYVWKTIFVVPTPENYFQVKSLLLEHVPYWKNRTVYTYQDLQAFLARRSG